MPDFFTVAAGYKAGEWLLKEFLGPTAKDLCQDFLKQSVSDRLTRDTPEPIKKAITQSVKEFLVLFQSELDYWGWAGPGKHELKKPLQQLIADPEVRQELGKALDTNIRQLNWRLIQGKWDSFSTSQLPSEFDWEQLIKSYVRAVKDLVRNDAALSRLLELDRLASLDENLSSLAGLPVGFDLVKYQKALKEKFGSLSLDSLDTAGAAYDNLRLWKVFVAQDVRECAEFAPQLYELPKEWLMELQAAGELDPLMPLDVQEQRRRAYAEKPVESVSGVVGLNGTHSALRAVILGDPGSGKSTLLRAMALSWAEKSWQALQNEPIPILIELRLYAQDKAAGKYDNFLEYLHKGNTVCHLNQRELDALLKKGSAVALFDGVDEVFDPKLREAVVNDIHRFSNDYPQVQMVVTSRWLGYKAEALRKAEFQHYMLQDLNKAQIEDFLRRWHDTTFTAAQAEDRERKQVRLQKAITESRPIRELAGNPLLLTMMAILNRNQELPRDRARLYEQASKVLLYQWDVNSKIHEQEDLKRWQIDDRDKQAMLRKVAHHMQANEKGLSGNVISRDDLERILTEYLKTLEVNPVLPIARIMIKQLRERNFILCYLGADNYAFVHRTFLEYFCASEFVHQFEKERTLNEEGLKNLYREHFQEESWGEVLRLIAGMVKPRFVGEVITHLLDQPINVEVYRTHLGSLSRGCKPLNH
jgi:predicted NACHT family NTPase